MSFQIKGTLRLIFVRAAAFDSISWALQAHPKALTAGLDPFSGKNFGIFCYRLTFIDIDAFFIWLTLKKYFSLL